MPRALLSTDGRYFSDVGYRIDFAIVFLSLVAIIVDIVTDMPPLTTSLLRVCRCTDCIGIADGVCGARVRTHWCSK